MEEGSAGRNHNLECGSGSEGLFKAGEIARAENQKRERDTSKGAHSHNNNSLQGKLRVF
jgi:hypothetical protein